MTRSATLFKLIARGAATVAVLSLGHASCTQAPLSTTLRALESSGPVSFLCLGSPTEPLADMVRPLSDCSAARTESTGDYSIPHLYALVTQPVRGEVAVVDMTTQVDAVIDQDPVTPGANFLPVGGNPVSITATPGSMATFVGVAQPGFEGIYGLPSSKIRGDAATLTSWPSCSLPAAPGEMVILLDPANADGALRPSCDTEFGEEDPNARCGVDEELHCHGDLSIEAAALGTAGRYKLLVTLPSAGGVALIDAQSLLDQEAGAFEPCRIERWLPLTVEVPVNDVDENDDDDGNDGCASPKVVAGPSADGYVSQPAGMTVDGDRLYIADRGAPLIHRIAVASPCEPEELPPLFTRSQETPSRAATTSRVAVSPLTQDLRRYLYAVDIQDGSIMVFDVSDDASNTLPLNISQTDVNPFQPGDRIRFQAPPRDIIIVQHENDASDEQTGATIPVACDPDPNSSGPGTVYQTSESYDAGAGPQVLRGVFAFAVLTSGDVVAIDIEDYDRSCRGPQNEAAALGCTAEFGQDLNTSGEYSCNVVVPHQPRAAAYLTHLDNIANNQPGIESFPILFDAEGSLLALSEDGSDPVPRMRATIPADSTSAFNLVVASELHDLDPATGLIATNSGQADPSDNTLTFNAQAPRAHIIDQSWTVTYEGALPGFAGRFAELHDTGDNSLELYEISSQFCEHGVISQTAVEEKLTAEGSSVNDAKAQAILHADYVQILSSTPAQTDSYWTSQNACSFNACKQRFGTTDNPHLGRDLRIVEASEDALALTPRDGSQLDADPALKCCFPGVVEFTVRAGAQWVALGNAVGFIHNVLRDDRGLCRPSCDSDTAIKNSRIVETPLDTVVSDDDPAAFHNPFFRFAINSPGSVRDMRFTFSTQGAFRPLVMTVVTSTSNVQPQAIEYLPETGELLVSDGSREGITLLDLNALGVSRQYN